MNNKWQDNLRDRMEWHEEPAPEGLWNDIVQQMSAENTIKGISTDLRIRKLSRRLGIVAASAIILFFIGLYTLKENNTILPDEVPVINAEQVTVKPEKKLLAQESKVEETAQQITYEKAEEAVVNKTIAKYHEDGLVKGAKDSSENSSENDYENNEEKNFENNEEKSSVNSYESNNSDLESINKAEPQIFNYERKKKTLKLETDVYASNISSGANSKHGGFGSLNPLGFPSEEEEYVFAAIRSDSKEGIEPNSYNYVYTDIKHSQPIKLGVSLKYNLDNNWSITSGLSYTILSSQLRSGNEEHFYESQQSLHYIGVPLNITYTVWKNNKFSTYFTGGGLVEKNISGSLTTDYFIANKIETSDKKKISEKQLQWSVNSAIGIQYQISKNIGIYSEPGVALHFKNNSDIETIYKEKPLNFDIRFGLRFSLNE